MDERYPGQRFDELLTSAKNKLSLAELEAAQAVMRGENINDKVRAQVEATRTAWKLLDVAGIEGERDAAAAWDGYISQLSVHEYERSNCGGFCSQQLSGPLDYISEAMLDLTRETTNGLEPPVAMLFGRKPMLGLMTFTKAKLAPNKILLDGIEIFGARAIFSARIPPDEIRLYRAWPIDDIEAWCGKLSGWTP